MRRKAVIILLVVVGLVLISGVVAWWFRSEGRTEKVIFALPRVKKRRPKVNQAAFSLQKYRWLQ